MEDQSSLPVVILSTADMNAPIWTNKQHIAVRLASERRVHYVESLGLRRPSLTSKDVRRLAVRLKALFVRVKPATGLSAELRHSGVDKVVVHAPLVIPVHASRIIRKINHKLVAKSVLAKLPDRYILWTFSPLTYGLEQRAERVIYHSVDLLHTLPGIPRDALLEGERSLIKRADAVIASSGGVATHLQSQGARPLLWENVADVELFYSARATDEARERRAIFVGNLTPSKIDFSLLDDIVANGGELTLVGPISVDGTKVDPILERLLSSPKVRYLGTLSQKDMALEIGRSWIGLIPYQLNSYTSGVFPMKVYEYIAGGVPVVSTALHSIRGNLISGVTICEPAEFGGYVADMLKMPYEPALSDLAKNSWNFRLNQIRSILDRGVIAEPSHVG